jgi:hypothetical protein
VAANGVELRNGWGTIHTKQLVQIAQRRRNFSTVYSSKIESYGRSSVLYDVATTVVIVVVVCIINLTIVTTGTTAKVLLRRRRDRRHSED